MSGLLLDPPNTRRIGLSEGVVKRFEEQIKDESSPLVAKFITWRNLLTFVEEGEDLMLENETNKEIKKVHRSMLGTAILLGDHLGQLGGIDQVLAQLECSKADLDAKMEMLRYKERMWYGDLGAEKSNLVLNSLFSGL